MAAANAQNLRNLTDAVQNRRLRQKIICDRVAIGTEFSLACQYAGVPWRTAMYWRTNDRYFVDLLAEAYEHSTNLLETEAWRRAFAGSDTMLIFMLKARKPDLYRERVSVDLTSGGMPLELDDAQRAARLLALIAAAQANGQAQIEHKPAGETIDDAEYAEVHDERDDGSDLF